MKYNFPKSILDYFTTEAMNTSKGPKHCGTLAFALGKCNIDNIIDVQELVFPPQDLEMNFAGNQGK